MLGGPFHRFNSNDFPDCHEEGEAIVYVDDNSDIVHSADPDKLQQLIQQEAGLSAAWLADKQSVCGRRQE